jgi:hypothetical protein
MKREDTITYTTTVAWRCQTCGETGSEGSELLAASAATTHILTRHCLD